MNRIESEAQILFCLVSVDDFRMFSILRIHPCCVSIVRRLPIYHQRICASSKTTKPEEEVEREDEEEEHEKEEDEGTNIAAMIGPYMSSKQIAFHTGQFDSDQIQKKNKQAFLVRFPSSSFRFDVEHLCSSRTSSKRIKFNFRIVVVMWNLSELLFDE